MASRDRVMYGAVMRSLAAVCLLLAACAGAHPRSPGGSADSPAAAAEVLSRFAAAVAAGRPGEVWPLLSDRWRSRSTPATLAAELFAASQGADFIRTHDPAALRQALAVQAALAGGPG